MAEVTLEGWTFDVEGRADDNYFQALAAGGGELGFLAAAFRELQPPGAAALDVGANIGLTTLLMSRLRPEGEVLALEPSASTFGYLQRNLAAGAANATALRTALGAAEGPRGWVDDAANSSASHLSAQTAPGADAVPVSTLDGLVAARGLAPAFIKIDVEGFELDVLEGGERTLRELRPVVFLELNSFTLTAYGDRSPKALIAFLLQRFAHVFRLQGDELQELRSELSVLDLLHRQFTSGSCVDDLLCIPAGRAFDLGRISAALRAVAPPVAPVDPVVEELNRRLAALQAEHAAVVGSRAWRLATGLHAALRRLRGAG